MTDIDYLRGIEYQDQPTQYPLVIPETVSIIEDINLQELLIQKNNWPYKTIYDYNTAYLSKTVTPTEVIQKILNLIESEPVSKLNAFSQIHKEALLKEAEESTIRFKENKSISVLDGIPYVVKDQMRIKGFECLSGTDFCNIVSDATSTVVNRLQQQGCILLGTATMALLGANAVGYNTSIKYPSSRNPFNTNKYPGGSSSGSAVAVACGIVPFAIGSDSLGSIRIPASYCGIVGLKPTFARVSNHLGRLTDEISPLFVIGPMANCIADASLVYAVISGPDENYSIGLEQPPVVSPSLKEFDITKIKFGIHSAFSKFAESSVLECLNKVCEKLKEIGCSLSEICIPELRESSTFSLLQLSYEIKNITSVLNDPDCITKANDVSIALSYLVSEYIDEKDILKINQQRTRSLDIIKRLFEDIDVLILPTTCSTAPTILDDDSKHGFLNINILNSATFFLSLSCFTGIPSLSLNVGYEESTNMPIGIQLISKWWTEDILLSVANCIENMFPLTLKPNIVVNPLD